MRSGLRGLFIALFSAGLTLAAWGALRICSSCGREARGDETRCENCGAELPPAEAVEPAGPEVPTVTTNAPPVVEVSEARVAGQARAARTMAEKNAWWGVLLYARNASALAGLRGPGGVAIQQEMSDLQARAHGHLGNEPVECPVCEGKGQRKKVSVSLRGEAIEQVVAGASCPACHGHRTLPGRAPADRLRREESDARQVYELEQKKLGLIAWRGIFVPAGLPETLEPRQIVALYQGFGARCPTCEGFRKTACDGCKGTGILTCPEGCIQGQLICPDCGGRGKKSAGGGSRSGSTLGSSSSSLGNHCETCKGVGISTCKTCEGRGWVKCDACRGAGESLCKTCKGAGVPAVCSKCKGDGISECTRCKGSGKDRRGETCDACDGRGHLLCKGCDGSGRSVKR